jgi:hypothetical protein
MYDGGSEWSAWPSYLSFFRHVAQLDLPAYERWQHYENAALNSGGRMMHAKFCIVADRQTVVLRDAQNRLHSEHGPARAFADGWALYYWRGTRLPAAPEQIRGWDAARILSERNAETRRAMIEIIGWDQFITAAGLRKVSECADPGNDGQTIALYDLPSELADMYEDRARILLCTNGTVERDGTRRRFGLPVPAHHDDPIAAVAEMYDMPVAAYRQLEVRR